MKDKDKGECVINEVSVLEEQIIPYRGLVKVINYQDLFIEIKLR